MTVDRIDSVGDDHQIVAVPSSPSRISREEEKEEAVRDSVVSLKPIPLQPPSYIEEDTEGIRDSVGLKLVLSSSPSYISEEKEEAMIQDSVGQKSILLSPSCIIGEEKEVIKDSVNQKDHPSSPSCSGKGKEEAIKDSADQNSILSPPSCIGEAKEEVIQDSVDHQKAIPSSPSCIGEEKEAIQDSVDQKSIPLPPSCISEEKEAFNDSITAHNTILLPPSYIGKEKKGMNRAATTPQKASSRTALLSPVSTISKLRTDKDSSKAQQKSPNLLLSESSKNLLTQMKSHKLAPSSENKEQKSSSRKATTKPSGDTEKKANSEQPMEAADGEKLNPGWPFTQLSNGQAMATRSPSFRQKVVKVYPIPEQSNESTEEKPDHSQSIKMESESGSTPKPTNQRNPHFERYRSFTGSIDLGGLLGLSGSTVSMNRPVCFIDNNGKFTSHSSPMNRSASFIDNNSRFSTAHNSSSMNRSASFSSMNRSISFSSMNQSASFKDSNSKFSNLHHSSSMNRSACFGDSNSKFTTHHSSSMNRSVCFIDNNGKFTAYTLGLPQTPSYADQCKFRCSSVNGKGQEGSSFVGHSSRPITPSQPKKCLVSIRSPLSPRNASLTETSKMVRRSLATLPTAPPQKLPLSGTGRREREGIRKGNSSVSNDKAQHPLQNEKTSLRLPNDQTSSGNQDESNTNHTRSRLPNDESNTEKTRSRLPNDESNTKEIRLKLPNDHSNTKEIKLKLPNDHSNTKEIKLKLPNDQSSTKEIRLRLPNDQSNTVSNDKRQSLLQNEQIALMPPNNQSNAKKIRLRLPNDHSNTISNDKRQGPLQKQIKLKLPNNHTNSTVSNNKIQSPLQMGQIRLRRSNDQANTEKSRLIPPNGDDSTPNDKITQSPLRNEQTRLRSLPNNDHSSFNGNEESPLSIEKAPIATMATEEELGSSISFTADDGDEKEDESNGRRNLGASVEKDKQSNLDTTTTTTTTTLVAIVDDEEDEGSQDSPLPVEKAMIDITAPPLSEGEGFCKDSVSLLVENMKEEQGSVTSFEVEKGDEEGESKGGNLQASVEKDGWNLEYTTTTTSVAIVDENDEESTLLPIELSSIAITAPLSEDQSSCKESASFLEENMEKEQGSCSSFAVGDGDEKEKGNGSDNLQASAEKDERRLDSTTFTATITSVAIIDEKDEEGNLRESLLPIEQDSITTIVAPLSEDQSSCKESISLSEENTEEEQGSSSSFTVDDRDEKEKGNGSSYLQASVEEDERSRLDTTTAAAAAAATSVANIIDDKDEENGSFVVMESEKTCSNGLTQSNDGSALMTEKEASCGNPEFTSEACCLNGLSKPETGAGQKSGCHKSRNVSNSEAEEESEAVLRLRHEAIEQRKLAEQFMLDSALGHAVQKLAPGGDAKVKVLVKAFESVLSRPDRVEKEGSQQRNRDRIPQLRSLAVTMNLL